MANGTHDVASEEQIGRAPSNPIYEPVIEGPPAANGTHDVAAEEQIGRASSNPIYEQEGPTKDTSE